MIYSIFRNNILIASVKPQDTSELFQKKQQEDIVRLTFVLNDYIDFKIGDNIILEKTKQLYFLNKKPHVIENPKNYKYECIFEGLIHELKKTRVFLDTPKTEGYYRDFEFSLTGNAETFLNFIITNLNRNGNNYSIGSFKVTSTINIQFQNWNVFEAINEISKQLDFDWYLNGTELNFDGPISQLVYTFQVGRFVGLTELTRTRIASKDIATIVYGYGSTKNLPPRIREQGLTYDSELLSKNRLYFEGVDSRSKLEKNKDLYGDIETVQIFDNIHPEYKGKVTSISADLRVFTDIGIDFDIEVQKMAGIKPKLTFITGLLIGLSFDIAFDGATNQITMDYYSDESGQYPNELIYAGIGDEYVLYDLIMPQIYIVDASNVLKEAVQSYIDIHSKPLELYEGTIDEGYIKHFGILLHLGDLIRIISEPFQIDNMYEIKELTQNINNIYKYSIKFGDVLPKGLLSLLKDANFSTQQQIGNVVNTVYNSSQVTNVLGQDLIWDEL